MLSKVIGWRIAGALVAATATAQSGWVQLTPATHPSARSGIAIAYDPVLGRTVLFGGLNTGDTWTWNGTNWLQTFPTHTPPSRRTHGLASRPGSGRLVLFGGWDGFSDLGDTWEYDGSDWIQLQPAHQPPARHNIQLTLDPTNGMILLFGGGGGPFSVGLGDTWHWDGNDWTQRNPTASPPARFGYAISQDVVRGRVVLWGGHNNMGGVDFTDTWTWDGATWLQLATNSPPIGVGLAMVQDVARDLMVLVGGPQTWLFDGSSWRVDPRAGGPVPRTLAGVTHDVVRGRTVLFGGFQFLMQPELGDTWEYAPGAVAGWAPFGAGCSGTAGTPRLAASGTSLPIVGTQFALELTNVPVFGFAVIAVGFSATQWGSQSLPMDLALLGMPNCTLYVRPDFLFYAPIGFGHAHFVSPVANSASLVGMEFWNQALVLDQPANPAGAVVANAGAGVIGPF
jgi:hypothetical protein